MGRVAEALLPELYENLNPVKPAKPKPLSEMAFRMANENVPKGITLDMYAPQRKSPMSYLQELFRFLEDAGDDGNSGIPPL